MGLERKVLCNGITNAVLNKITKVYCDGLLIARSSNFIILAFVLVSHKIFC